MSWGIAAVLVLFTLAAFLISWLTGFLVRAIAPRLGLVDKPGGRKLHPVPMPTGGGIAIWAGVVVPLAAGFVMALVLEGSFGKYWGFLAFINELLPEDCRRHLSGFIVQSPRMWTVLMGGLLLGLLGLWDDRVGLDWRLRLAIHFVVAAIMVALGWRASLFLGGSLIPAVLSAIWIVALVNAFNMIDNMDGLAAGVGIIASLILAAVMLLAPEPGSGEPQLFVGGFFLVLAGALGGFLIHNWPTARLFMGDAGSYFVGFTMALLTLAATFAGDSHPPHAVMAPLCALAIPLYDMTTVVLIRICSGRSPFEGDRSHFSHRLVELGLSPLQAVLTIWLATASCGLGALLLHQVNPVGAILILLIVLANLVLVRILESAGQRQRELPPGG
ncbi:MAG: undecaprenyl/decaprenyl-phosphate alpha-N-acetylglucosaminyl 1-phosphate transferase [Thermoguttaceae bacterium]|nr:undecaprenyl/decaprenyl-phosphate alpha-N-acetylglucosaminyl 1-phosphate transferase [Thermoguttaceae bacterium]MDW8079839.1 MraY family glycosyltransferase [Thermoguttaceae bacterium]